MLLPLLGACAVMGPFQGPEWEPVRGLLSQDQSCKDPRCCGNLLVSCLFLIWQIQQYWYRVSRTSKRNTTKAPSQRWAVSSTRRETFCGMIPEFFTHGESRDLDVPVQQWTQKQRWRYRKSLRQQWAAQYLLSPQNSCQDLSWVVHTSSEPIFCASSFPSTCLFPQDNSWEAWQVRWCTSNNQAHPPLDICLRMEQLRAPSQEKLVPVEPVSLKYNSISTALAISRPKVPLGRKSKFCLRGFLPVPLKQQSEPFTKKFLDSSQDPLEPQGKTQTVGREYNEDTLKYTNKRRSKREVDSEIQASGGCLPTGFGAEKDGEAKVLGCGKQRLERREIDGEISMPEWEKQDPMGTEDKELTEKLWEKSQREPGDKDPSVQAHVGENPEQYRCKTNRATQTPSWENREDAVQTLVLGKENEKDAGGKEEAGVQDQGLETQSWTGGKESEDSKMLHQGTQDQMGGNTAAETEAEEGRNKSQSASEDGVKIQTSGQENPREVKQDNNDAPALEWEKQECVRTQNEVQTPAGDMGEQTGSETANETHAFEKEDQSLSRREVQMGMEKPREIMEEDWLVIQAPWWGNQRQVLIAIDRGLRISCWGNQEQAGRRLTAENQSLESDQRQGGGDERNDLTSEAENQGQLRGKNDLETYPVERKDEGKAGKESGTDMLALGKRNLRGDEARTQKCGEEDQGRLGNEFHKKIHVPKWKNWEQTRGSHSINKQTSEAEDWEEITSNNVDGTAHAAGHKEAENGGCTEGAEVLIQWLRLPRGSGGEETESKAAMEESQSWLGSDLGTNTHSSESDNRKWVRSEVGTEVQASEKRKQREPGGDGVKTQSPESKNLRQLTETGGSRFTRQRTWKWVRGEKASGNGASEKERREGGRKIQRARRKKQRVLSKVNRKTYLLVWKTQQHFRDGNGAKIQKQGKRNLGNVVACDDGPETQTSLGEDKRRSVCETHGKIQTQGRRIQNKGRDAAAAIQDVGTQGKCRAEDSEQAHNWRRRDKGQIRRKGTVMPSLQDASSGRVGPTCRKYSLAQPISFTVRYGASIDKQPGAGNGVDSAPCPEEHLSSKGTAPAQKCRGEVRESSQDKRVGPSKAYSLTSQRPHPQPQASSVFPSLLCPQVSQVSPALASAPMVLTTQLRWPAMKKSKHLLLESLMKRRIAHLRWGLPRRILESYLLFHFLESCSLPRAGVRLPGFRTDQERQRQQQEKCKSQGSLLGSESPDGSQSCSVLERKNSKLSTQVQALEKCRSPNSEPMRRSIPPKKPRRIRPPGGAREPQIQEAAPMAKSPAPRNPRPAAESRSWCGSGQDQELSAQSNRGREMVRPVVSHVEERASSIVRASSCTEGHRKKEHTPRKVSELPRLQCQQSTSWRSGSIGPAEGRSSAHTSSFKENVHSAAARLSMTILSKMPWSQLVKPQYSAPFLTQRNPTPFSRVSAPYTREDNTRVPTALERDLEQPPGHCCPGVTVYKTESVKERKTPGNLNGAPRNPAVSQKFGFMRHLRYFLRQYGLKK